MYNLNIEIFCSGFCSFPLFVSNDTNSSYITTTNKLSTSVISVCEIMFLTIPVTEEPTSFVNVIESSTFNSVVNKVLLPLSC